MGRTALHGAAKSGHEKVVKLLLDKGANVNMKNRDGQTALDVAQEKGHKEIVKILKAHGAKEGQ